MYWLICGLGNPGAEYAGTRHNAGFEVLDILGHRFEVSWAKEKLGQTVSLRLKGRPVFLLKPETFMNQSGKAVRHYLDKLQLSPAHLLVITDDIALPVGTLRLRQQGSPGGHKGLASIQEHIGHGQWPRLRIGVGHNFLPGQQAKYVLSAPEPSEMPLYTATLDRAADAVLHVLTRGLPAAMNAFNGPIKMAPDSTSSHGISNSGRQQPE